MCGPSTVLLHYPLTLGGPSRYVIQREGELSNFHAFQHTHTHTHTFFLFLSLSPSLSRHAHYSNQFRAMFVMNCRVNREEVLRHVPRLTKKEKQRKRWRKGRRGGEGGGGEGSGREEEGVDEYHPVHCAECNTEIAVYDKDEVFHFYNVLASAAS